MWGDRLGARWRRTIAHAGERVSRRFAYAGVQSGVFAELALDRGRVEGLLPPETALIDGGDRARAYVVLSRQTGVGVVPDRAASGALGSAVGGVARRAADAVGARYHEALMIVPRVVHRGRRCSYLDALFLDSRLAVRLGRDLGLDKRYSAIRSSPDRYTIDALGLDARLSGRRLLDPRHGPALEHVRVANASGCLNPGGSIVPGFRTHRFTFGAQVDVDFRGALRGLPDWGRPADWAVTFAVEFRHVWEMCAYTLRASANGEESVGTGGPRPGRRRRGYAPARAPRWG